MLSGDVSANFLSAGEGSWCRAGPGAVDLDLCQGSMVETRALIAKAMHDADSVWWSDGKVFQQLPRVERKN